MRLPFGIGLRWWAWNGKIGSNDVIRSADVTATRMGFARADPSLRQPALQRARCTLSIERVITEQRRRHTCSILVRIIVCTLLPRPLTHPVNNWSSLHRPTGFRFSHPWPAHLALVVAITIIKPKGPTVCLTKSQRSAKLPLNLPRHHLGAKTRD